nr:alpha/beta hydrolase [Rhizobium sp. Root1220]
MHLEKPLLAKHFGDRTLKGYAILQKIFFASSPASQDAGQAFIGRLMQRTKDREPVSGRKVAGAQIAAFREGEQFSGERFADLKNIRQPTLVVNGVGDQMIPVRNSYWLSEILSKAVFMTYPDAGHGSLFQYHEPFTRQAAAFPASDSPLAPY